MNFQSLTPRTLKKNLLFIAALVWSFAGGMLLFRGFLFLEVLPEHRLLKGSIALLGGVVFFIVLFQKISRKHVNRINNLPLQRPCLFSFFNLKSYFMMFLMISGGIFLRKSGLISVEYLALIYLTMGIPLLLSSIRFYMTFYRINKLN